MDLEINLILAVSLPGDMDFLFLKSRADTIVRKARLQHIRKYVCKKVHHTDNLNLVCILLLSQDILLLRQNMQSNI